MIKKSKRGFSLIEVMAASALFAFVTFGIIQGMLLAQRYSKANLFKLNAHLIAMSYLEQIIMENKPYALMPAKNPLTTNGYSISVINLSNSSDLSSNKVTSDFFYNTNRQYEITTNGSIFEQNDLTVHLGIIIQNTHLENEPVTITDVFAIPPPPPSGFQSIQITYSWNSPNSSGTWPSNAYYVIRELNS